MEGDSDSVSSDVGGMTAGEVSESYGNFGGSLAESLGAVAESLGSGTGGYDMGGGGSSMADAAAGLQDALGPTDAGMFGMTGPVGVAAGTPGVTDVSTGLSGLGLGDIAMGGFGIGGIQGLGTSPDGVSGEGLGAGTMATGSPFSESLADIIGGNMPGGFNLTGVSTVSPSVSPFGGAGIGTLAGSQMSPAALGQLGPAFGFTGPANVFAGAPYEGAEIGLLGATGVPGTRANALQEQQTRMMEQVQQNPTYEITEKMPVQDIVTAMRNNLFATVPNIPGVPPELQAQQSTLAMAAAVPATAATVPSTPAPVAAAPTAQPQQAPQQTAVAPAPAPAPVVSRDVSPAVVTPTPTGTAPKTEVAGQPRSMSAFQQETFADPLTGAQITVADGVPTVSGPPQSSSFFDSPMFSTAVNTGLSIASPYLGIANLGLLATTGTGLYGQARSLATGQGFQTGGGLMGLANRAGPMSPSAPTTDIAYSGGEPFTAGTPVAAVVPTVPTEVINPVEVQRVPANPYGFNIADFIAPPYYSDTLPPRGYRA